MLGSNFPKLGGDDEMDMSNIEDTVLSPLSSSTYPVPTVERGLGEHYGHRTLLLYNRATLVPIGPVATARTSD